MSDGIIIKVEHGDKKIEIKIGKDVNPEQLKVIQKVLEKIAESSDERNGKVENRKKNSQPSKRYGEPSRFFKVKTIIATFFNTGQWFTSIDLRELYEETYGENLGSTTASTYLRRMETEGLLESRKRSRLVEYRVTKPIDFEPLISEPMVTDNNH